MFRTSVALQQQELCQLRKAVEMVLVHPQLTVTKVPQCIFEDSTTVFNPDERAFFTIPERINILSLNGDKTDYVNLLLLNSNLVLFIRRKFK